jgi:O-antigen ligase
MMMNTKTWVASIIRSDDHKTFSSIFLHFFWLVLAVVMFLGGMALAMLLEGKFSFYGLDIVVGIFGLLVVAILLLLRQEKLIIALIIVIHLYIDLYFGVLAAALIIPIMLLPVYFLRRSPASPWVMPRAIWLWLLLLVLCIPATIQGGGLYNFLYYYCDVFAGALLIFWLGIVVANNEMNMRMILQMIAAIGTFFAIVTIIQFMTGTLLFGSSRFTDELLQTSDFALFSGSSISRAGSFFVNPDWNGTFFSIMLFLPIGLFIQSSSLFEKILYFIEIFLILIALLATFSTGAWVGAFAGIAVLLILIGYVGYRLIMLCLFGVIALAGGIFFSSQINAQLQHATAPNELALRQGVWQTAINVIRTFPLTGIGLSQQIYLQKSSLYQARTQYLPLAHPHDAYLEIGAMAGLPVLAAFLAVLLLALWLALRNWMLADQRSRPLIGAVIASVFALSINSISINGWTLPPLAALGWLILGLVSSPLLKKSLMSIKKEG